MGARRVVEVVVVVLLDERGRTLARPRPPGTHLAGFWEWPGGKIEPNETPEHAARRELLEETGVTCESLARLCEVEHPYPDRTVRLTFFLAQLQERGGTPTPRVSSLRGAHGVPPAVEGGGTEGVEREGWSWVDPVELARLPVPAANLPALEALRSRLA